jgi:hypothetical protein
MSHNNNNNNNNNTTTTTTTRRRGQLMRAGHKAEITAGPVRGGDDAPRFGYVHMSPVDELVRGGDLAWGNGRRATFSTGVADPNRGTATLRSRRPSRFVAFLSALPNLGG